jgi:CYTH domain-containing protein
MEIERKWMVSGWPEADLPLITEQSMRQGYVCVRPTVRIREEAPVNGDPKYILCFKSSGLMARKEIEMEIPEDKFNELEDLIGLPLIPKTRRDYRLPDGLRLEVSHVDAGAPTEFWYAEVEYPDIETANNWDPASCGLADFLNDEVTNQPGQSMGAYWEQTRLHGATGAET